MLYLLLIASLSIYKAAAQCNCDVPGACGSCFTECSCETQSNCYWDNESCEELPPTPNPTTPEPTTAEPTLAPTCPTNLGSCEAYDEYGWDCCPEDSCTKSTSALCVNEGNSPDGCCSEPTPAPTTPEPTTSEPTARPTYQCPTVFTTCSAIYEEDCCELFTQCIVSDADICGTPDAPGSDCCVDAPTPQPTTPEPTTPSPTTPEPTTPEPTTPSPITPEPTTPEPTTPEPTTPSPTTPEPSTPSPTTPEPTTSTTESSESDEDTSTTESSDDSSEETTSWPTKRNSWPTPRPTLPSAEKWEMIHPAYKGNDGELLWQVYYGDFSNDDRFDSFRSSEKWDTKEIKPIIMKDAQFKKYRNAESKKFNQQSAVVTDNNTGAHSYGTWLIVISAVLILLFAAWYKYGNKNDKSEYTPLLTEEKVQYDQ